MIEEELNLKDIHRNTPMWWRIVAWLCALLLVFALLVPICTCCDGSEASDTESVVIPTIPIETTVPSEPAPTEPIYNFVHLPIAPDYPEFENLVTIYDVEAAIKLCDDFLIECNRVKLYPEVEHPQTGELIDLIETAEEHRFTYESMLAEHWYNRERTRPVMTEIWHYLSEYAGFNHAVTAGIIGNICAESGDCGYGDIQVHNWDDATGRSYYGLCQWSVGYYPEIANTDLKFQLDYLIDTYDYAFTYWGYNYSDRYGSKFRTEQFLAMEDPYEAAIAFAVCYERCGRGHVEMRGPLADKTYEYFTVLRSWPWPDPEPVMN